MANTLGTVVKYREDNQRVEQHGVATLVQQAISAGRAHSEMSAPSIRRDT